MRKIMISIALVALMLTGCSKNEGKTTAVESIATDTVATIDDASAEEATTEAVIEAAVSGNEKPEAVPATTEIGGGKKKAEETTEEKKPSTTESAKPSTNHNNSGSASSGQSTTPKPSNNGSSGNSGSNNGGNSNSTPSPKPSTPATTEAPKPSTTEAPTTQHQHVYDQVVVDTPEQRIDYPEQGYYAPAMQCHGCHEIFTSSEAYFSHPCGDDYGYSSTQVWVKTKDPYTEVIPAKTHRECKCGARE